MPGGIPDDGGGGESGALTDKVAAECQTPVTAKGSEIIEATTGGNFAEMFK